MILMLFIQSRRIALLSERLDDLTQGADGQESRGVLATHLDTVIRVGHDLDEVIARTAILEGGRGCISVVWHRALQPLR